jgi:hypothetical protein
MVRTTYDEGQRDTNKNSSQRSDQRTERFARERLHTPCVVLELRRDNTNTSFVFPTN